MLFRSRVLIVEDSEMQRESMRRLFAANDFAVVCDAVGSLAEAEQHVGDCDFVVLDLSLPDAMPADSLEWLTTCGKPSIVISSSDDRDTIAAAADAGAIGFISKGDLSEQICTCLNFAKARERNASDAYNRRRQTCQALSDRVRERFANVAK